MELPGPIMRISTRLTLLLTGALLVGVAACENDLSTPEATEVSLVLTDAPGNVAHLWVDLSRAFLVADDGSEVALLTEDEAPGVIDVASLDDGETVALIQNVAVPSGEYDDLMVVFDGAALETEDGEVLVHGDITVPGGRTATGTLECPACGDDGAVATVVPRTGGSGIGLAGGSVLFVLDFDLPRSVTPPPPEGGDWALDPMLQVSSSDALLRIIGNAVLAESVAVPECPAGVARDIDSFIPLARSVTFNDRDGADILRSGATDAADGIFSIRFLQSDQYDLEYVEEVVVSDDRKLVFEASALPQRVVPDFGVIQVEAQYTIESVTCEAR